MENTSKTSNVITINGTDYSEDSFSKEQKYMISQIKDLQGKISTAKFQLDQLRASSEVFVNRLIESVENEETVEEEKVAS
jgi:hypothetical protein|tara:strand:+ start:375 stop:614 length:240 start_codon:yes stop_codon:yes gene_type:complete